MNQLTKERGILFERFPKLFIHITVKDDFFIKFEAVLFIVYKTIK